MPSRLQKLKRLVPLIVLSMGGGSIYILPYLSSYYYIPMKDAMHLDNTQLGLMGSAMGLTAMLFYWPGGWMADRFSPRKQITLSFAIQGLLGLWLAAYPSFKALVAIQLLMGVFLTLTYWSALIKLVRQIAPPDYQGRYFGFLEGGRNCTAVIVIAFGMLLFDFLGSDSLGLRWTIILFSVELFAMGILSWFCLPEIDGKTGEASRKEEVSIREAIRSVVRIPAVWLVTAIILCAYVTSVGITYLTPYATDVYRQSVVFGGMLYTIMQWTSVVASPTIGLVADRWTTSRTTLVLLTLLALSLLLFVVVTGDAGRFWFLLINSIVIGCLIYALRGIYYALLEEGGVPVALTGTATGLISLIAYTPDVFIPYVAGRLLDRYSANGLGYRYFFLMLVVFSAAGAALTWLFRKRASMRESDRAWGRNKTAISLEVE